MSVTNTIGHETLSMIESLSLKGVSRMCVLMRHSARHYDPEPHKEPFMGLTEEGKDAALAFGKNLPSGFNVELFSSVIGRCIETAYLVDKGYMSTGGSTKTNNLEEMLSPFYITDLKPAVTRAFKLGMDRFIREWFDGEIPVEEMMPAQGAAEEMISLFAGRIKEYEQPTIQIGVTHDWNVFLAREFGLSLTHESIGEVAFMEGVIIYENPDNPQEIMVVHPKAGPAVLPFE